MAGGADAYLSSKQHWRAVALTVAALAFLLASHLYDYFFGLTFPKLRVSFSAIDLCFEVLLLGGLALLSVGLQRSHAALAAMNEVIESRVTERTRQLAQVNQELEAFSYSVSHDLRAPLRRIEGFAKMVEEMLPTNAAPELGDYMNRIRQSINRMSELIEDLLRLSRITRQEIKRARVDLSSIATSVLEELRHAQPERNVTVNIAAGLSASADSSLARVVFENLLSNAWKFTARTDEAHIEFGRAAREGRDCFYVRDNGAGFDPNFAERLFGVFQRMHKESEFPGTGVGLAIVKRIVERHGGAISAESQPGQGATFYFSLESAASPSA